MADPSKKAVAHLVTWVLLITGYLMYANGSSAPEATDLQGWARRMLVFIVSPLLR